MVFFGRLTTNRLLPGDGVVDFAGLFHVLDEIAAEERKSRARFLYEQVNEDVPIPTDQGL